MNNFVFFTENEAERLRFLFLSKSDVPCLNKEGELTKIKYVLTSRLSHEIYTKDGIQQGYDVVISFEKGEGSVGPLEFVKINKVKNIKPFMAKNRIVL